MFFLKKVLELGQKNSDSMKQSQANSKTEKFIWLFYRREARIMRAKCSA